MRYCQPWGTEDKMETTVTVAETQTETHMQHEAQPGIITGMI